MALKLNNCFILNLILLLPQLCRSGFVSDFKSINKCTNPNPPYQENCKFKPEIFTYRFNNKLFARGNITVEEDITSNFTFHFNSTLEEKHGHTNRTRLLQSFRIKSCKNLIIKLMFNAMKIKFDPKTCKIMKGKSYFNNLDVTSLADKMNLTPYRLLGANTYIWTSTMFISNGTLMCFIARTETKKQP